MTGLDPAIRVRDLGKSFVLHERGGRSLDVIDAAEFDVYPGECVVLVGPSGMGKSSLVRMIYGNYGISRGRIEILHNGGHVDVAGATDRELLEIRRATVGYVSQFLRVIPRVPAVEVVMEPIVSRGVPVDEARQRAVSMLDRLGIGRQLQDLPPATFSGGEQQRINIARGLIVPYPVLLLDEPTASIDRDNSDIVIDMIEERRRAGAAIVGIFHDDDVRDRLATRTVDVARFRPAKVAAE